MRIMVSLLDPSPALLTAGQVFGDRLREVTTQSRSTRRLAAR
jgi:hypothetical protein